MAQAYDEPIAAVAQRIRQAHAAAMSDCTDVIALAKTSRDDLCPLELIDTIEEATDYDMSPSQAARIADAVLRLLRRGPC
jgi:hypothetical protein